MPATCAGHDMTSARARVPELDGIRGLAILMVMVLHFDLQPRTFSLGWAGVDLFFVLSGFLITGILMATRETPRYFRNFYARRVLRIFPVCYVSLILYFHLALPMAQWAGRGLGIEMAESVWYYSYLSNWRSAFGHDVKHLSHFWSLAIEEQFYLFWPLLIYFCPAAWLGRICAGVTVASLAARIAGSFFLPVQALYRLTPFRLDALALGGLVAVGLRNGSATPAVRRQVRFILIVAILSFGALAAMEGSLRHDSRLMSSAGYTVVAVIFACCVFFTVQASGVNHWASRALRGTFLTRMGKYSYAMYILHFPIAFYTVPFFQEWADATGLAYRWPVALASIALGMAITYGLALLSWRSVEEPFLKLKGRFEDQPPLKTLPGQAGGPLQGS